MEHITCHGCGTRYPFNLDLARISLGTHQQPEGVVVLRCPNCDLPRSFLLTPELQEQINKRESNPLTHA